MQCEYDVGYLSTPHFCSQPREATFYERRRLLQADKLRRLFHAFGEEDMTMSCRKQNSEGCLRLRDLGSEEGFFRAFHESGQTKFQFTQRLCLFDCDCRVQDVRKAGATTPGGAATLLRRCIPPHTLQASTSATRPPSPGPPSHKYSTLKARNPGLRLPSTETAPSTSNSSLVSLSNALQDANALTNKHQ